MQMRSCAFPTCSRAFLPAANAQRMRGIERRGEQQHGAGLMRGGERHRHDQQQRRDAECKLQQQRRQQQVRRAA